MAAIKKADKRFENSGLSIDDRVEQTNHERSIVDQSIKLTNAARRKNQIDAIKCDHPLRNIKAEAGNKSSELNKMAPSLEFKSFKVIGGNDD